MKWTRTTAEQTTVHMAKFEEGRGRVMYVTRALEHERPFVAPLCKFVTIHPRHSVQAVPSYVAFFLRFLASQVEQRRHHHACAVPTYPSSAAPRDEHRRRQSEQESEAGSREPGRTVRWFSLELKRESWPWMCEKSDKPSLLMLEALAERFSLVLFFDDVPEPRSRAPPLNQLMASRYPASAVLMSIWR